jgi:hypothetical protein
MSLKDELGNIEIEEEEMEEEGRLREIDLHRRIRVIAEHIDKEEEKATAEEEELWDCGYSEGYEDGVHSVISDNRKEIEAIEKVLGIPVPSQNLTSLSHAIQNFMGNEPRKEELDKVGTSSEYAKGYEDGIKLLSEKMRVGITQAREKNEEIIEMIEKELGRPTTLDLATIISETQSEGEKETPEEPGEQRGEKEPDETKSTKNRVLGLGRAVGDV